MQLAVHGHVGKPALINYQKKAIQKEYVILLTGRVAAVAWSDWRAAIDDDAGYQILSIGPRRNGTMLPTPKAERLSMAFNRLAFSPEGHRLLQSPQALPLWDAFSVDVAALHAAWHDHTALWHGGFRTLPHPEQHFTVIPCLGDVPDPAASSAQLDAALDELAGPRGKRKRAGSPTVKRRRRLACTAEEPAEAPARQFRTPYTRQLSDLPAVQARKTSLFGTQFQLGTPFHSARERALQKKLGATQGCEEPGGERWRAVAKAQEEIFPPIKMTKGTFRLSGGVLHQVSR